MQNRIGVLLVENQTLTRVGIRTILSGQSDIEIVGEAANGAEGFQLFKQIKPDVTILSLRLPELCRYRTRLMFWKIFARLFSAK